MNFRRPETAALLSDWPASPLGPFISILMHHYPVALFIAVGILFAGLAEAQPSFNWAHIVTYEDGRFAVFLKS
jgi:hypothetical protein